MSKEGFPYAFGWVDFTDTLVITDGMTRTVRSISTKNGGNEIVAVDWDAVTIESGTIRFLASGKVGNGAAPISDIFPDNRVQVKRLSGAFAASGPRPLRVTPEGKLFETLDSGKNLS